MSKVYDNLRDMIEGEIEGIVKIGELNQNSLCNLDKLVDIAKDIEEIEKHQEDRYGYSGYRGNYDDGYSRRGREMYENDRYDNRYRSPRETDGYIRYEGDMKYSGDMGNKEHMLSLMRQAMEQATSQEEHDEIMKMVKKIEK